MINAVQKQGSCQDNPEELLSASKFRSPTVLLATLAINFLALVLPLVVLQIYDRIITNQSLGSLVILVSVAFIALLFDAAFRYIRFYLTGWTAAKFEHKATCAAVDRLLYASHEKEVGKNSGFFLDQIAALDRIREYYANQGFLILIDIPFVVLFLTLITIIGGSLVLVPLGLLSIFAVLTWLTGHHLRHTLFESARLNDQRMTFIVETLNAGHSVKSMAMENLMIRRYEQYAERLAEVSHETTFINNGAQSLAALASQLSMVLITAVGGVAVINGNMTIGGLAACTMLTGRTLQPIMRALGIWIQFQSVQVARKRFGEIFKVKPDTRFRYRPLTEIRETLELSSISVFDKKKNKYILNDVSLQLNKGRMAVICRYNGEAKTALSDILTGMRSPTSGEVLADGVPINRFRPDSIAARIGYVPAQVPIFQGTILDNLMLFRDTTMNEHIFHVLRQLRLDEFIFHMPQGLQSQLSNASSDFLPGGIRRRLGIARAILMDPDVLIIDQAATSLDVKAIDALAQMLESEKAKRAILLFSNHPKIICQADRTFLLGGGKLKQLQTVPHGSSEILAKVQSKKNPGENYADTKSTNTNEQDKADVA